MTKTVNIGIIGAYSGVGERIVHHLMGHLGEIARDCDTEIKHLYCFGPKIQKSKIVAWQSDYSDRDGIVKTQVSPGRIAPDYLSDLEKVVDELHITVIAAEANPDHMEKPLLDLIPVNMKEIAEPYAPILCRSPGTKIVVTNPTDIITFACAQYAKLEDYDELRKWIGMNHLDTDRFKRHLRNHFVGIKKVDEGSRAEIDAFAIGPHYHTYCVFNYLKLNGVDESEGFLDKSLLRRNSDAIHLDRSVRTEAGEHIDEGMTTIEPTAEAIFDTIKAILDQRSVVTASAFYEDAIASPDFYKLGDNRGLYIGVPVHFKDYKAIVHYGWLEEWLLPEDRKQFSDRFKRAEPIEPGSKPGVLEVLETLIHGGKLEKETTEGGLISRPYIEFTKRPEEAEPLTDAVYAIWTGKKIAKWRASQAEEPENIVNVKVGEQPTTPTALKHARVGANNYLVLGHKAGMNIYDENLKLRWQCLLSDYHRELGQFNSITTIDDMIFASHFRRGDKEGNNTNGIYTAQVGKDRLHKIMDGRTGLLAALDKDLMFTEGMNLYRMVHPKFKRPEHIYTAESKITCLSADNEGIQLGDDEGNLYILNRSLKEEFKDLIVDGEPITAGCLLSYKGNRYSIVGTEDGQLIGFDLKARKPEFEHPASFDEKTEIRSIAVSPKQDALYVSTSNLPLRYQLKDLFTLDSKRLQVVAKAFKGAGSSIFAVDVVGGV